MPLYFGGILNLKFSLIVPIYQVENFLNKCVESLRCQTYKDIEIILVDDGSTDNCPIMCDMFAKDDLRIKVVHKENGGLSDARNKGLEVATGDYVLFVDSDDYIEKNTCECFFQYAWKGYDVLIGDAIVEGGYCDLEHVRFDEVLTGREYLLKSTNKNKSPMAAWLNVYKREFLTRNNLKFKYGILHEDEEFTPRCFLLAKTVVFTGVSFYHYVIRKNSITQKLDKRKNAIDLFSTCLALEQIYDNLQDKKLKKNLKDSLSEKYLNIFQIGSLWQYGSYFYHKKFVFRNACRLKTKLKALLYVVSPRLYFKINRKIKEKKR